MSGDPFVTPPDPIEEARAERRRRPQCASTFMDPHAGVEPARCQDKEGHTGPHHAWVIVEWAEVHR